MDGIDVALIETDGQARITLGRSGCFPYSEADRALLRRTVAEAASLDDRCARPGSLALSDTMIMRRRAEAVEAFLSAESMSVDLVGSTGKQSRIGRSAVSPFRSATARLLLND